MTSPLTQATNFFTALINPQTLLTVKSFCNGKILNNYNHITKFNIDFKKVLIAVKNDRLVIENKFKGKCIRWFKAIFLFQGCRAFDDVRAITVANKIKTLIKEIQPYCRKDGNSQPNLTTRREAKIWSLEKQISLFKILAELKTKTQSTDFDLSEGRVTKSTAKTKQYRAIRKFKLEELKELYVTDKILQFRIDNYTPPPANLLPFLKLPPTLFSTSLDYAKEKRSNTIKIDDIITDFTITDVEKQDILSQAKPLADSRIKRPPFSFQSAHLPNPPLVHSMMNIQV